MQHVLQEQSQSDVSHVLGAGDNRLLKEAPDLQKDIHPKKALLLAHRLRVVLEGK